jgi:hypothetical protein
MATIVLVLPRVRVRTYELSTRMWLDSQRDEGVTSLRNHRVSSEYNNYAGTHAFHRPARSKRLQAPFSFPPILRQVCGEQAASTFVKRRWSQADVIKCVHRQPTVALKVLRERNVDETLMYAEYT